METLSIIQTAWRERFAPLPARKKLLGFVSAVYALAFLVALVWFGALLDVLFRGQI